MIIFYYKYCPEMNSVQTKALLYFHVLFLNYLMLTLGVLHIKCD